MQDNATADGREASCLAQQRRQSALLFYVGTYSEEGVPGIYLCRLDQAKNELVCVAGIKAGANPSFLAIHPTAPCLYAVNELSTYRGQPGGAVSAFAVDSLTGNLTLLNQQPSHGDAPCHVAVDRSGRYVMVANYSSGTLAMYPVEKTGALGAAACVVRHQGNETHPRPHAHAVHVAPDNRFVVACDLGLDKLFVYRLDLANAQLLFHDEVVSHPGAGPRHLDFHPNGRHAYVINELNSTVTAYTYDAKGGRLGEIQTASALPRDCTGTHAGAEIAVHPSGRFVYASNRGHDSLAIYVVDETTGRLSLSGHESTHGRTPRNFVIDPTGSVLLAANQDSNTIVAFFIDPLTGSLNRCCQIEIPRPVCLQFATHLSPREFDRIP